MFKNKPIPADLPFSLSPPFSFGLRSYLAQGTVLQPTLKLRLAMQGTVLQPTLKLRLAMQGSGQESNSVCQLPTATANFLRSSVFGLPSSGTKIINYLCTPLINDLLRE